MNTHTRIRNEIHHRTIHSLTHHIVVRAALFSRPLSLRVEMVGATSRAPWLRSRQGGVPWVQVIISCRCPPPSCHAAARCWPGVQARRGERRVGAQGSYESCVAQSTARPRRGGDGLTTGESVCGVTSGADAAWRAARGQSHRPIQLGRPRLLLIRVRLGRGWGGRHERRASGQRGARRERRAGGGRSPERGEVSTWREWRGARRDRGRSG